MTNISRRLRRSSARALEPFGLTDAQGRVLRHIARAGAPLRMSELARRIEIVPRSATTVVESLESQGLVAREIDLADRRSILVHLTAAGEQILAEVSRARDEAAEAMFKALRRQDRRELARLLGIVAPDDVLLGDDLAPGKGGGRSGAQRR
ncbi:MAG TPA: MarR family transcriptional regulator [Acidimicrobiales bacterium]|nr:MarR family transcriptional regulator [Acidimicrobiales bacterium]